MTSSLAKLFRISISKGNEIITIKEELEHVKSYLIIQKIRYMDKFDFEIDVDESILQNRVLKILLQPLVENSIYHGIKNKTDPGLIKITGERVNDKILLQVIDDGVGMSQETLKNILVKDMPSQNKRGVGVKNVNDRIKLYFGDEYGIEFQSELEVGTTVKIRIPVLE
jgi:two-component system sensor histidine kinase YesM